MCIWILTNEGKLEIFFFMLLIHVTECGEDKEKVFFKF